MKKLLLAAVAATMGLFASAQTSDKIWNIGIEGGGEQYNGSFGNAFYQPSHGMYGFGGLSIYRYMSDHLDGGIQATAGGIGYKNGDVASFKNNMYQANLNLRFSFFKYDKVRLRPFVLIGFGDIYFTGNNLPAGQNADNITFPDAGFGLTFRLTENINLKLQETFVYPVHTSTEGVSQDGYLLHSFGLSYNIGRKLDADRDGVADKNDKCPNTPAGVDVDKMGCPLDRDGDGIPDYLDACPDVKGVASAKGCPDADGDGVSDSMDKCPNTPAGVAVDAMGCPLDRDGDGVPDYKDACPDVKGTAALQGCPDADGDGVADANDKCPNTPAGVKVDANGCPLDRDGDGVPDYKDKCPDVKGAPESDGCPVVNEAAKEIFKKALEGIEFQSGKDVLEKRSYAILDEVVKVMKENPSYKLAMNGYTDNKGKPEANKILSEKRAITVKKYLEAHGIAADRLTAAGFGEEHPISDNKTEAGRKKNRRVEFVVSF